MTVMHVLTKIYAARRTYLFTRRAAGPQTLRTHDRLRARSHCDRRRPGCPARLHSGGNGDIMLP
jgi:hypothetical protein